MKGKMEVLEPFLIYPFNVTSVVHLVPLFFGLCNFHIIVQWLRIRGHDTLVACKACVIFHFFLSHLECKE